MADQVIVDKTKLTNLADKIRTKTYKTDKMTIDEMSSEVTEMLDIKKFIERTNYYDIQIPEGVTRIGLFAFYQWSLIATVRLSSTVTEIGIDAFYMSALSKLVIPIDSQLRTISFRAFYGTDLTSIELPTTVTTIAGRAFQRCTKLTSITIPSSVINIAYELFNGCTALVTINFAFHDTIPTLENVSAFTDVASGCQCILPDDLYDEWIASDVWKDVTTLTFIKASEVTA